MKKIIFLIAAFWGCLNGFAQGDSGRFLTEMKRGDIIHEFSYDFDGRISVVQCRYYNWISTYDYSSLSDNIVTMKVERTDSRGKPIQTTKEYTMSLGENGLISRVDYIVYEYVDQPSMSYEFSYNDNNNLVRIVADEGGQVYDLEYDNGNMVSLTGVEDWAPDQILETHYTYGDDQNVGKLVFYDFYLLSFDELDFVYLTGLMGEQSINLMTDAVLTDGEETQTYDLEWYLDERGYPYEMTWKKPDGSRTHTLFTWSGLSGVNSVKTDDGNMRYYSVDGIELAAPRRGINIVRNSDGSTFKVLR